MKFLKLFTLLLILSSSAVWAQDTSKALKMADKAIPFTLKNATGQEVALASLLAKGPVVLTWYRGGWCPYCNVALKQLQQKLPQIKALGATLVALSPELPDNTLSTKEKDKLEFEVLSDLNNEVARMYGIVFKLSPETGAKYNESFQLNAHNGSMSEELPFPATYIIDKSGVIQYAFVDADYKKRVNVDTVVAKLKKLK